VGNEIVRAFMDAYSDEISEWQGVPVPVPELRLQLCAGHPLAAKVAEAERILYPPEPSARACHDDEGREVLVNQWFSRARNVRVYLLRDLATGRTKAVTEPVSPGHSMVRLRFALRTLGAAAAWTLDAEAKALDKLAGLLSEHQIRQYLLTGSFLETSRRSRVTYLFRRLRPTVALTPRHPDPRVDSMRCLAVLCLHPVGFYQDTWAGCLTPTDDVIAHLLLVRGDEPGFWRQANQHPAWTPEAGL
jgi:hypothetical protein